VRIWADHGLKPWGVDMFKISNDPRFRFESCRGHAAGRAKRPAAPGRVEENGALDAHQLRPGLNNLAVRQQSIRQRAARKSAAAPMGWPISRSRAGARWTRIRCAAGETGSCTAGRVVPA
jgi:hypothetical protein